MIQEIKGRDITKDMEITLFKTFQDKCQEHEIDPQLMHPPKTCKVAYMDVEYMMTTSSPMETLNFKWFGHVYTHAAALGNIPTLWCEKQLTKWIVPSRAILIDESLYAAQYAAREIAISIMTKAGSQSSNVIKDQLEKDHAKLFSHDIFWALTNYFWNACCGDQSNSSL